MILEQINIAIPTYDTDELVKECKTKFKHIIDSILNKEYDSCTIEGVTLDNIKIPDVTKLGYFSAYKNEDIFNYAVHIETDICKSGYDLSISLPLAKYYNRYDIDMNMFVICNDKIHAWLPHTFDIFKLRDVIDKILKYKEHDIIEAMKFKDDYTHQVYCESTIASGLPSKNAYILDITKTYDFKTNNYNITINISICRPFKLPLAIAIYSFDKSEISDESSDNDDKHA